MKKVLGFMVMALGLLLVIPNSVKAAVSLSTGNCTNNSDGTITCSIGANITTAYDSLTITLTEKGGADVTNITNVAGSEWSIASQSENNGIWTVVLTLNSPDSVGEFSLFTFTYKPSGEKDCEVNVAAEGATVTVVPDPTPETGKCTKSDGKYFIAGVEVTEEQYKNECPSTGTTLPYIALGAIVLVAGGAYVATKNKAKMYKI